MATAEGDDVGDAVTDGVSDNVEDSDSEPASDCDGDGDGVSEPQELSEALAAAVLLKLAKCVVGRLEGVAAKLKLTDADAEDV